MVAEGASAPPEFCLLFIHKREYGPRVTRGAKRLIAQRSGGVPCACPGIFQSCRNKAGKGPLPPESVRNQT